MTFVKRVVVAALVAGITVGAATAGEDVGDPAVAVVDAAIASLRQHPNQLSITVSAAGGGSQHRASVRRLLQAEGRR